MLPSNFIYDIRVQFGGGSYFGFVAIVFFIYWASSRIRELRLVILVSINYLFCAGYGILYLFLLPACSGVDFVIGLGLVRFRNKGLRRSLLCVSVLLNLAVLIFSRRIGLLLSLLGSTSSGWNWAFPLGLSFYALQSLTYTMDLYRRDSEGTSNLLVYFSAASFFPTLLAGPITRLSELVKRIAAQPLLSRIEGGQAFFLIGSGLLKKALIADYLANNLVNPVFDTPNLHSGAEVLIAVYAYSMQLYYDFSGYTDIARGTGLLLGIKLPINFDLPYGSANIAKFWRRWHITFSNWLRDYLYFSLPGARTRVMPYLNLIITMLLGGLWHGIAWTFAVWGLLHGTALAATRLWGHWRGRPKQPITPLRRTFAVFCTYQFVCFTWIFFRASSLSEAVNILQRIASLSAGFENISPLIVAVLLISALGLFISSKVYATAMDRFSRCSFLVHAVALLLVAVAVQFLSGRGHTAFVYSRF